MPDDSQSLVRLLERIIAVLSEPKLESVLGRIMDGVVEFAGARHGFLIVRDKSGFEVRTARNMAEEDIENPDFEISRTLLQQVFDHGQAVRRDDMESGPGGKIAPSLRRLNIRSVLCLPMPFEEGAHGAIYLDHPDPGKFTKELQESLADFLERIRPAVRNALRLHDLEKKERRLRGLRGLVAFDGIVGASPALVSTLENAASVSAAGVPVLLLGESGVGKEMIARAIHAHSPRAEEPFVAVNCAALTEPLLESELFGHVRGAFSGADRDRAGLFESADGGTLFLDEVGDTSPAVQAKLLRAVQSGEVRRVGSDASRTVDVRIVSATNKDLAAWMAQGRFREDLYYRLGAIKLTIPPLRERKEDIPILAARFLKQYAAKFKKDVEGFEDEALAALVGHPFPGNVRELQNVVQHAVLFARGTNVKTSELPFARPPASPMLPRTREELKAAKERAGDEVERLFLTEALRAAGGNVTRAAESAGMDRTQLQHLLAKHRLAAADFQPKE